MSFCLFVLLGGVRRSIGRFEKNLPAVAIKHWEVSLQTSRCFFLFFCAPLCVSMHHAASAVPYFCGVIDYGTFQYQPLKILFLMAQNYSLMARKNLLKPNEAPKFYAVARSGRKVTVKEVCRRISERSSYSRGELEGCIGEFLLEIVNVLSEGNIAQMGDLGNFRMSLKTGTPTATEKEFKASCIEKGKVIFFPGSDLRKLCKTLDYTLYKGDSKPEPDGEEPLPDGNGDDGETPDPGV